MLEPKSMSIFFVETLFTLNEDDKPPDDSCKQQTRSTAILMMFFTRSSFMELWRKLKLTWLQNAILQNEYASFKQWWFNGQIPVAGLVVMPLGGVQCALQPLSIINHFVDHLRGQKYLWIVQFSPVAIKFYLLIDAVKCEQ